MNSSITSDMKDSIEVDLKQNVKDEVDDVMEHQESIVTNTDVQILSEAKPAAEEEEIVPESSVITDTDLVKLSEGELVIQDSSEGEMSLGVGSLSHTAGHDGDRLSHTAGH